MMFIWQIIKYKVVFGRKKKNTSGDDGKSTTRKSLSSNKFSAIKFNVYEC